MINDNFFFYGVNFYNLCYNTSEKTCLQGFFHAVFQHTAVIRVLANHKSESGAKIFLQAVQCSENIETRRNDVLSATDVALRFALHKVRRLPGKLQLRCGNL